MSYNNNKKKHQIVSISRRSLVGSVLPETSLQISGKNSETKYNCHEKLLKNWSVGVDFKP